LKKKKVLILLVSFILILFAAAGCDTNNAINDNNDIDVEMVELEGYVGINRQGEEIDGDAGNVSVRVSGEDISTTTDEYGRFSLLVEAGRSYDIYATREGLATTKVQNLYIDKEYPGGEFMILIKEEGPFDYDTGISELTVRGVKDFDYLDEISSTIFLESSEEIYEYYIDLNNNYWKDFENRFALEDRDTEIAVDNLNFAVNYGGPPQQLVVFVVNNNNHVTMEYFHLLMPASSPGQLPGSPASLEIAASTYKFSQNLLSIPSEVQEVLDEEVSIQTMPEGTMLWNTIYWSPPEDGSEVEAYNVYRSFDGSTYNHIETTTYNDFRDIHPELEPERRVWYKIKAVNQHGESKQGISAHVKPLPVFEITLLGPVGDNIYIDPLLEWETNNMNHIDDVLYLYEIEVRRGTRNYDTLLDPDYGWEDVTIVDDKAHYAIRFSDYFAKGQLVRGETYEWGITWALAQKVYVDEEINGSSVSSFATTYGALLNFVIPENSLLEFHTIK